MGAHHDAERVNARRLDLELRGHVEELLDDRLGEVCDDKRRARSRRERARTEIVQREVGLTGAEAFEEVNFEVLLLEVPALIISVAHEGSRRAAHLNRITKYFSINELMMVSMAGSGGLARGLRSERSVQANFGGQFWGKNWP